MFCVGHVVTTKQKPIAGTQKIRRRELKHITVENHHFSKEDSKRKRKEQRKYKTAGSV